MKTTILFAFLFVSTLGLSQTKLAGKVLTNKNEPVYGARIIISGTYDGTNSDPEGRFFISTSKTDSILLNVKCSGFDPVQIPLILSKDSVWLIVHLRPTFKELEAVTITAGSFAAGDKKKAIMVSALDLMTVPSSSGNVIGALQSLPGTSNNGESGKLFVRGGASEESQSFIDGALVFNPYNISAPNTSVRSRFNPFLFEGPVFSTGGFSAEYGQSLSSVLLLETKGLQEKDQLDISILNVSLGLAGTKKWDKTAITASLDYSNLMPYMNVVKQDIRWDKMPETLETGLNFRHKTTKGMFKVYGNYLSSNFTLYQPNLNTKLEDKLNLSNDNIYLNSSYTGKIGEKSVLKLSSSFTDYKEKTGINSALLLKKTFGGHAKARLSNQISSRIQLVSGAEVFAKEFTQNYTSNSLTNTVGFTDYTVGGFVEGQIYFTEKIVARIGGRIDHSSYLNQTKVSPRISAAYKFGKYSQMSLAGGAFYQSPNDGYLLYTQNLNFESANQIMLNYSRSKNSRSIKVEGYYKVYSDLVKFDGSKAFYLPSYYTSNGKGFARGIDVFYRDKKTIKNGDFWISYSYLDTERDYLNYPVSSTPSFAAKHNFSFVYKHWINAARMYVGANFSYTSPRLFNDPNEKVFNNQKMRANQTLNLNISYLFKQNVIFYAAATNVFGAKQEFGYRFADNPNSEGVYEKALVKAPASRFFILGCFITLSKSGKENQLDKIQ